jgi:7-keto-8-aminopelargonate synthetase-like enzyme
LVVDEAHALGVLVQHGEGFVQMDARPYFARIMTFEKAWDVMVLLF